MEDDLFGILDEVDRKMDPFSPYRVLVTGSRYLEDRKYVNYVLDSILVDKSYYSPGDFYKFKHNNLIIVHGDAKGADTLADKWAKNRARDREIQLSQIISIETYPAQWEKHGKSAGPMRNKEMIETGIDLCIAFPHHEEKSVGTMGCIKMARSSEVPVINALEDYWPKYIQKYPNRA